MKHKLQHAFAGAFLLVGTSGCASLGIGLPAPQTPAQAVYELAGSYNAALSVAVAYKSLPACGTGPVICSDAGIVAKLQRADDVAEPAIKSAEAAVRVPGFGSDALATSVAAAQNAVSAFVAITATLHTH